MTIWLQNLQMFAPPPMLSDIDDSEADEERTAVIPFFAHLSCCDELKILNPISSNFFYLFN